MSKTGCGKIANGRLNLLIHERSFGGYCKGPRESVVRVMSISILDHEKANLFLPALITFQYIKGENKIYEQVTRSISQKDWNKASECCLLASISLWFKIGVQYMHLALYNTCVQYFRCLERTQKGYSRRSDMKAPRQRASRRASFVLFIRAWPLPIPKLSLFTACCLRAIPTVYSRRI